MKGNRLATLILTGVLFISAVGCQAKEPPSVSKTNLKMDTVVTITVNQWEDPAILDLAFDEIDRLDALLSVEKEGSDLDRLAKAAGREWVEIAPETEEVLRLAQEYGTASGHHFDVTAGPLIDLWNIHDREGHYPTEAELAETLPRIDPEALQIEEGRAYLTQEGMKVNLGAIAKGYIGDQVKKLLIDQGVESAVLDLGRDILLIGGPDEESSFTIGVQDPAQETGELITALSARDKSIVTSGIDERYFVYEGKEYHHILDPFTGFPADTGVASVTIISETSAQGDALSTSCLLLGLEDGMALIESLDEVEALFITTQGKQICSSGFDAYRTEL